METIDIENVAKIDWGIRFFPRDLEEKIRYKISITLRPRTHLKVILKKKERGNKDIMLTKTSQYCR